jgi:RNA 2',3'-cyclic 3'-phosphodiesterase
MSDRWRCFVAVPLDDSIRSSLARSVAEWRQESPADALRWADADGWHLTVAFLGDVEPERLSDTEARVASVAVAHPATQVETARLGAFPRPGSARTLWYGVFDPGGLLAALAGALAATFELPRDEPFRPHITLARARRRHVDLRGWIERASESAPTGRLSVAALQLMRSHLGAGPARYETLGSWRLGGQPA